VGGLADLGLAGGGRAQAVEVADVAGLRVEGAAGAGLLVQDPDDEVAVVPGVVHQAVDVVGDVGVVDQPPDRAGTEGLLDIDHEEGSLCHVLYDRRPTGVRGRPVPAPMRNDPVTAAGACRILVNIRGSTVVHREDAFKPSTTPELIRFGGIPR